MKEIYMIVNKTTKQVRSYHQWKHTAEQVCARLNRIFAKQCMKDALDIKAPKRRGKHEIAKLAEKMADGNYRVATEQFSTES